MTEQVVWKQELKAGVQVCRLPIGARILSVAIQHGRAQMWFLCDPSHSLKDRIIVLTGTGHPLENVGAHKFIGTMMTDDQSLVFHVFERVDAQP